MRLIGAIALLASSALAGASETTRPVDASSDVLRYRIDPKSGGAITVFGWRGDRRNAAGEGGLSQEGFGVGSHYAPGRRVNERAVVDDANPGRPVITVTYECEGPRIDGLAVERRIEAMPRSSTLKSTWTIHNRGAEPRWIVPWVRHAAAPGGRADDADRLDLPTPEGILSPNATRFMPATRNWAAVTDTRERETVFGVFDAETLHSWKAVTDTPGGGVAYEAWFAPSFLAPGESWSTTYIVGLLRGLDRIDFATELVAGNLDATRERLQVEMGAVAYMETHRLKSVLIDDAGRTTHLSGRRFTLERDRILRTTYADLSLSAERFDFLARVESGEGAVHLNAHTRAPHEGIDTRFSVDGGAAPIPAWTDGPHRLDRKPRPWPGASAKSGPLTIGVANALAKVFEEDVPGALDDPAARVELARNEAESFQLLLRLDDGSAPLPLSIRVAPPRAADGGPALPVGAVSLRRVEFVPVAVPSHFENPTGRYPDPLAPLPQTMVLKPGRTLPLWITVRAPAGAPAGTYRGALDIQSDNRVLERVPLTIEIFDVDLDRTRFQSDFGLDVQRLRDDLANAGYTGDLKQDVHDLARDYGLRFRPLAIDAGDAPFEEVARYATAAERPGIVESLQRRRRGAPPSLVVTRGLNPFLPDDADHWSVHLPVFDTAARPTLLRAIDSGKGVWVHVDHEPSRPYPNLLLENSIVEHRTLFWRAWSLGARGFQYWNAYAPPTEADPRMNSLDATPVNGNGVLIYAAKTGPLPSIRLAAVRDGLEDAAYLDLLSRLFERAKRRRIDTAVLRRAEEALNLDALSLGSDRIAREPIRLRERRAALIRGVIELRQHLREAR